MDRDNSILFVRGSCMYVTDANSRRMLRSRRRKAVWGISERAAAKGKEFPSIVDFFFSFYSVFTLSIGFSREENSGKRYHWGYLDEPSYLKNPPFAVHCSKILKRGFVFS